MKNEENQEKYGNTYLGRLLQGKADFASALRKMAAIADRSKSCECTVRTQHLNCRAGEDCIWRKAFDDF